MLCQGPQVRYPMRMPGFPVQRTESVWAQQGIPEEEHWSCFPSAAGTATLVSHLGVKGRPGLPVSESKMIQTVSENLD